MKLRERAKAAFAAARPFAHVLFQDVVGIFGACLICYGAAKMYEPAGYMLAGLMLVVLALVSGRSKPKSDDGAPE